MLRQPLGVVAAITPFNFPAMIPLWFLPWAIACGNTFILKPSEKVPLTAVRLVELIEATGLPAGVVNLVQGGQAAASHCRKAARWRVMVHEVPMNSKIPAAAALAALLIFAVRLSAQAKPGPFPHMAPVARYLMPRAAEIALARSAAPPAISNHATVLVLTRHGYVTAAKGTNGFVCFVERSWDSTFHVPKFWNPRIRGANCVNAPAARSVLPLFLLRTQLALARRSQAGILEGMRAALAAHRLPPLEPNAISYMLSKGSYLTDSGGNLAHVMFYIPPATPAELGANLPGSPIALAGQLDPSPIAVFIVATRHWSDGTPAM
ncbi:MAG TPA: aldehyde dehydrogenase family protein [Terriglobales bacterium]|nr:aldehyde dehydrogenase family protein [Terriglobales bacterium]